MQITMNKLIMHTNWLMELYNDIMMIVMMLMILLYVQWLYAVFMLVCQSVWFSYGSTKSHPYTTLTSLVFVINIPVYWYPLFTDLFSLFSSNFSLIIVWFFARYWVFMCSLFMNVLLFILLLLHVQVVSQAVLICPLMGLSLYVL